MDGSEPRDVFLDALARVLVRCFLLGLAALVLWFVLFLVSGEWIYAVHSRWFEITRHDFHLMNYMGMALLKAGIVTLFLFPYLSIRWTLRNSKRAG